MAFTLILPLGVVSLSSRYRNGCVAMSDGSVACWGSNDMGQLGNGTKTDSTSPVVVTKNGQPIFELLPIRPDDPGFLDDLIEHLQSRRQRVTQAVSSRSRK